MPEARSESFCTSNYDFTNVLQNTRKRVHHMKCLLHQFWLLNNSAEKIRPRRSSTQELSRLTRPADSQRVRPHDSANNTYSEPNASNPRRVQITNFLTMVFSLVSGYFHPLYTNTTTRLSSQTHSNHARTRVSHVQQCKTVQKVAIEQVFLRLPRTACQ